MKEMKAMLRQHT